MGWGEIFNMANTGLQLFGGVQSLLGNNGNDYSETQSAIGQELIRADQALRERIIAQTEQLNAVLSRTYESMGPAPTLTAEQVNAEANRRYPIYENAVDRAATAIMSRTQADQMRNGMDLSTYGLMQQGEIAGQIADKKTQAYTAAYEDALRYLNGLREGMTADRNARLAEVGYAYGQSPQILASMYGRGTGSGASLVSYAGLLQQQFQGIGAGFSQLGSILDDWSKAEETTKKPSLASQTGATSPGGFPYYGGPR